MSTLCKLLRAFPRRALACGMLIVGGMSVYLADCGVRVFFYPCRRLVWRIHIRISIFPVA
ncbi:hypothetical protein HanIR_Chr11g0509801 [Helianthus annuus]|nr:hypothetical protein HanIR_Chr11g0509801 [Helianthus annuus]